VDTEEVLNGENILGKIKLGLVKGKSKLIIVAYAIDLISA
jgi:hypothetical protein